MLFEENKKLPRKSGKAGRVARSEVKNMSLDDPITGDKYRYIDFENNTEAMLKKMSDLPCNPTAYVPTERDAAHVEALLAVDTPLSTICKLIGIAEEETLRNHFGKLIDTALPNRNAQVASRLFRAAMDGNVVAMIFWLKTRAGFRENARDELVGDTNISITFKSE